MKLDAIITPAHAITGKIRGAKKRIEKAEDVAVRVEAFRLMRELRGEIRRGVPGGRSFQGYSLIMRTWLASRTGRLKANRPIAALARAIGYEIDKQSPMAIKLGFVGRASSPTWRRLAKMHQQGFDVSADSPMFRGLGVTIREYLRQQGARVDSVKYGGRKSRRRNVFFLRKSTTTLHTPARPIIDPFWKANRDEAIVNIRKNFKRKLAGERI